MRLCPLKTLYAALLLLVISTISASAYALNQTYQVYTQGGDYYLKTNPNWVPISGEIFIIIPVYQEGEILKLSHVNGNWQVQNVSLGEFNSASPSIVSNGSAGYADFNGDGIDDLSVSLGASGNNKTIRLISTNSQSSAFTLYDALGINIESPTLATLAPLPPEDTASSSIGTLGGEFKVDESGAASYSVPIAVPQGIAGVTPQLALSYSSAAGNGVMGVGWNLSGSSSISRCRKTHEEDLASSAITLTTNDSLCLDGQRLRSITDSGNGLANSEYRVVLDNQKRVTGLENSTSSTSSFKVAHPDGSVHTYTPGLLVSDDQIPMNWLLANVTDNMGNEIQFIYNETENITGALGENEFVLTSVLYSDNAVDFQYSTDSLYQLSGFLSGEAISSTSKLDSVEVSNQNQVLRTYYVTYKPEVDSVFNFVADIQMCAGTGSTCHEKTSFDWNRASTSANFSYLTSRSLGNEAVTQFVPVDIDGNGFSDIAYTTDKGSSYGLYVAYNNGSNFETPILLTTIALPGDDFKLLPSDIDGDGLVELVYPSNEKWLYYDFDQTNTQQVIGRRYNYSYESSVFDTGLSYADTGENAQLMDTTGDARPDFLSEYLGFFINSKQGFEQSRAAISLDVSTVEDHVPPICKDSNWTVSPNTQRMPRTPFDFNGDGRTDTLLHLSNGGGRGPCGNGFTVPAVVTGEDELHYEAYGRVFSRGEIEFGGTLKIPSDINSDGLSDIILLSNRVTLLINNGLGFGGLEVIDIRRPNSTLSIDEDSVQSFTVNDINSDGRPDIFYFYLSTKTWYAHYQGDDGVFAKEPEAISNAFSAFNEDRDFTIVADWDGDGKLGFAWVKENADRVYVYSDGLSNNQPNYTISKITNGFGIATDVVYSSLLDSTVYTKGKGAEALTDYGNGSPVYDIISPTNVVSRVTSDAPSSANASETVTVEYQYEAMRAQAGGRGLLGFEKIRTYDIQTKVTTETLYHQDYPFIGMPKETRRYLGKYLGWDTLAENQKLSFASNVYNEVYLQDGKTRFPYLDSSTETQYSLNDAGTATTKISSVTTNNTYRVESDNHANLTGVTVTTFNSSGAEISKVSTTNEYESEDVGKWWLGRVSNTKVTHFRQGAFTDKTDIKRESSFVYNQTTGMLEQETIQPNGTATETLSTMHCYDTVGNKIKTITHSGVGSVSCSTRNIDTTNDSAKVFRYSGVTYDDDMRYVDSTQDAQFTASTVNTRNGFGQPTKTTDINGVETLIGYDAFGRQYASSNEVGMSAQTTRRLYDDRADINAKSISESYYFVERSTGAGKPTAYGYFDKMGRQVASVKQGFAAGEWIYQYSRYDEYGRVIEQSVPSKTLDASFWTTTDYDVFGRPQTITSADTTVSSIAYNGLSTTTSVTFDSVHQGSLTQSSTEVKSVLGDTVSVTDNANGTIQYFYDHSGNLTKVIGVDDVEVTTKFDDLGRKIFMDDPNKGKWYYTYNAAGELVTQKSANLHTTAFYRDSVGRTTKRVVSGGSPAVSETIKYIFDGHQLKGECQLSGANCNGSKPSKAYVYDDFGRASMVGTELDGQAFFQSTTYDNYGRVFQQFDAAGTSQGIRYHYNARGYAYKQVEARNSADADADVYYEAKVMDAFGNVTEYDQNNGAVTNNKTYDPQTGYVTDIQADNGFLIQDNNYTFDAIGNLRTRTRGSLDSDYSKRSENFEYDTLNRLTHINNVEQVRYQANGNIDWKVDVNNGSASYYCYNPAQPHAVSGLGSQGCTTQSYQYDANGNMTQGRGRDITYGHFDKPTLISNTAGTTAFAYDLSRKRYKRETTENSVTTKTYYVGNVEFVYKDNVYSETRRYLPDAIQTQYVSTGASQTRYLHKDHLGSIDSMTDQNGKLVEKLYFDAWGKKESIALGNWDGINSAFRAQTLGDVLNINTVTPRGFTGHEHVEHADIIHMNGRIYDPTLGRFLQADPHIQAPKNSQSYNRYSYVLNNPLSYTDPSGYFFNKIFKALNKVLGKLAPFVSIALSIWAPWGTGLWASIGTGFVAGGIATGSLKGALVGAFTAGAFHGVGTHFEGLGKLTSGLKAAKVIAHGVVGGISSVLSGGKFGHGFASAGLTQALSGSIDGIDKGTRYSAKRIVAAATVGGTASAITGGKFANGALTGAFSRAFNDESHWQDKLSTAKQWAVENGGRVITGVGGTIQVVTGAALCSTGAGCLLGGPLIAHGANNIYEGVTGQDGLLRDGYQAASEALTGDARYGDLAYGVADAAMSLQGATKMVLKPDSWKLFRNIPSDYTRAFNVTSSTALTTNFVVDTNTVVDTYNRINNK